MRALSSYHPRGTIIQAVEALRRAHEELEIRVHERTAALKNANEALHSQINRSKGMEAEVTRAYHMMHDIIEKAPFGIYVVNEAGNIEYVNPAIFRKVCPNLSQDYIIKSLEHAVSVFGRNHVFSNILIGLGESDDTVIKGIEMLAGKGVIPILRKVNPHPLRKDDVYIEKVSARRLLKLASEERCILEKYGLDVRQALTGCIPCTGCDVTPVRDL